MHTAAWRRLADEEGLAFDPAIEPQLRGLSRHDSLRIILADRVVSEDELSRLAARKNAWYRASLSSLQPDDALPGARECVARLRQQGWSLAVGSASRNAGTVLERLDLRGLFDAVVDGDAVTLAKPDPEVFVEAARRLKVAPQRCVVIEDAPAGVFAARQAGMVCVGVGDPTDLATADIVVASVAQLQPDQLADLIDKVSRP